MGLQSDFVYCLINIQHSKNSVLETVFVSITGNARYALAHGPNWVCFCLLVTRAERQGWSLEHNVLKHYTSFKGQSPNAVTLAW